MDLIKWSRNGTIGLVASFAAIVSYTHIYYLTLHHTGESYTAAFTPLTVDALILASSLVELEAARMKTAAPLLAHISLWAGIGVTIAANVLYGLSYPGAMQSPWAAMLDAAINAWPAVALIFTIETMMQVARHRRKHLAVTRKPEPRTETAPQPQPEIVQDGGSVPTIRDIMTGLHCGQAVATDVQRIMRDSHVDMVKAKLMRDEVRNG